VVNTRAALLSNYEVLTLLRELENDHLSRAKTAVKVKKEEEASGALNYTPSTFGEASQNLRTVEIEVCGISHTVPSMFMGFSEGNTIPFWGLSTHTEADTGRDHKTCQSP
jgi:hypothetical protein